MITTVWGKAYRATIFMTLFVFFQISCPKTNQAMLNSGAGM